MLNVLIHAIDVITIAMAIVPLLLLNRRWMMWWVLATSPVFAILWYLHSWPSDWLGSLPPVIVDCSTFGLAFLGGHVAINPPNRDEIGLKRMYVLSFIVLAVVGVFANVWQRNVERSKQEKLQIAQTAAEIRFSADLKDVKELSKTSRDAILTFVANPPKGFTLEQLSAFAKTALATPPLSPQKGPYSDWTAGKLREYVRKFANELRATAAAQETRLAFGRMGVPSVGQLATAEETREYEKRLDESFAQERAIMQSGLKKQYYQTAVDLEHELMQRLNMLKPPDSQPLLLKTGQFSGSQSAKEVADYLENLSCRL